MDKYYTNNLQINNIKLAHKKLEKAYDMLDKAYQSNWGLSALNSSLLCALRARQLKETAIKNPYLRGYDNIYAKNVKEKATEIEDNSIRIANLCFNKIFNEISENGANSDMLIGYKNMGNFEV